MSNINKFLIGVLIAISLIACVQDDDYSIPDTSIKEPNIPASNITTFKSILERYEQAVNNGNPPFLSETSKIYILKAMLFPAIKAETFLKN